MLEQSWSRRSNLLHFFLESFRMLNVIIQLLIVSYLPSVSLVSGGIVTFTGLY